MVKAPKKKERISLEESSKSLQRYIDSHRDWKPEETRGVQPGTKRGTYKPRKTGQIKDKTFIKTRCNICGREFTYKRIGKRERIYCSDRCRQKAYRQNKVKKEIERKQQLMRNP